MREFLSELYFTASPFLVDLLDVVLVILLARISTVASRRWGIEIEDKHRAALHSALMSGVRAAVGQGKSGQAAIQAAVLHARLSVPDAISVLKPAGGVLSSIAEAKLREVLEAEMARP